MRYLSFALVAILATIPTNTFAECLSEDDVDEIVSLAAGSLAVRGGEVEVLDDEICELVKDSNDPDVVVGCKNKRKKSCSDSGKRCRLYVTSKGENPGPKCGCL